MNVRARIESLGVALPERRVTMDEVIAGCRMRLDYPLATWTGIQAHRRAGKDEFSFDLARRAIETCLAKSRYAPSDVELIINCNISRVDAPGRFSGEPATSSRLAAKLGFTNAMTFDITNACAGMFTGLALASDFLANGRVRRALIVSGEYISHLTDVAQREIKEYDDPAIPCLTLGDAGAALIVDAVDESEGVGFEIIDMLTLSRYCKLCVSQPTFQPEGGALMHTDSVRLASVATREGVRHTKLILDRIGKRPREFQHLIAHQTSLATLTGSARALNEAYGSEEAHEGNAVINLAERGNTASTTHFVAVWDLIHSGRIRTGDRILFTTVASGLVVGVGVYTLDDLPDRLRANGAAPRVKEDSDIATWVTPHDAFPRIRFEATGIADPSVPADTVALCRAAGEAAFKTSKYGRKDFTHLIFTGVHRTDWITEPAIATFIAAELRMNEAWTNPERSTFAFDLTQGATSFLTACEVTRQLCAQRSDRRVLVVGSEIESNAKIRPDLLYGIETSGVAIALDVSPDPARGLGTALIRRFPAKIDSLTTIADFGVSAPAVESKGHADALSFLVEQLPDAVSELLRAEGIRSEDVTLLLVPEALRGLRARIAEKLRIDSKRVFDPPEERVDRYASSLPYLIHRAQGRDGDIALLVELGSGLQLACALYRF